jgi:glycosyltransferase involved in cell wall biosynthesis
VTRVTVTAPSSSGHSGTADYARLLGAALEQRGFELVRPGDHDCAVVNFTPYGAGVAWGWLRSAREARSLARGERPLVTVFHEVFVRPDDRLRMQMFERLQRWAHRTLVRRSQAVVTSDAARARALADLVGGVGGVAVIPVGANVPVPSAPPPRSAEPLVVTFGLLHPLRDVETLVRSAPLVRDRVAAARVVIIGDLRTDPARARRLTEEAASLDAPVDFTGPLEADAVAAQLASARVFVSTYVESLSFGSGTLAAALGHGLAVVAYEDAELAAPLEPGRDVLTTPRDPTALADAIGLALGPSGDAVAAAGRSLYETCLTWDSIGSRFASLLDTPTTP